MSLEFMKIDDFKYLKIKSNSTHGVLPAKRMLCRNSLISCIHWAFPLKQDNITNIILHLPNSEDLTFSSC